MQNPGTINYGKKRPVESVVPTSLGCDMAKRSANDFFELVRRSGLVENDRLDQLLDECRQWKKDGRLVPVHRVFCRNVARYKDQRDANPDSAIDPRMEEMSAAFADHAEAVLANSDLADDLLLGLCESLLEFEQEPSQCWD